jgi:hypothetical protein
VIDGHSLIELLTGDGRFERDSIFWHYPHCDVEPYSAVRKNNFKLIEFLADGRLELYDLEADLGEKDNRAGRMPDKAEALRSDLKRWRESVGAQLPVVAADRRE